MSSRESKMRILFVTQALDLDDPVLSAYHGWVAEVAKHAKSVEAICLKEGRHALPYNVTVHSLGKDRGQRTSFEYAWRFLLLSWKLRNSYDAVFVHMNQEYLLVAGVLWKLLRKPAYLWRNHYAGSFLTDIAAMFSTKVFCTSKHSYTAKYKKTVLMPVGVDTSRFSREGEEKREPHSILFFARMAPSKRPDVLIEALRTLSARGVDYKAAFVGSPLDKDKEWYETLQEKAAGLPVSFSPGIRNENAPRLYRTHQIFVNTSQSGMLDKMIFEAAASGCLVVAASEDWEESVGEASWFDGTPEMLSEKIAALFALQVNEQEAMSAKLKAVAERSNLTTLGTQLAAEISVAQGS
jgi:glycosyltransferase involved in cell wall biosynthesis